MLQTDLSYQHFWLQLAPLISLSCVDRRTACGSQNKVGECKEEKSKIRRKGSQDGFVLPLDEQVCVAIYIVSGYDMGLAIKFVQQGLLGRGAKNKERIG